MATYKLPSRLASITNEVSGGWSLEITLPPLAKHRNSALKEALGELLKQQTLIAELETKIREAQLSTMQALISEINAMRSEDYTDGECLDRVYAVRDRYQEKQKWLLNIN